MFLRSREVVIWQADLSALQWAETHYASLLNEEEKQKSLRFRFPLHRQYYTLARGILRELLGRYLNQNPKTLQFANENQGKPYLPGREIEFNLSHSGDQALYGLTLEAPIGVDIEKKRLEFDEPLARRFYSEKEFTALMGLDPKERAEAFCRIWSRKEALLKAIGAGISYGFSSFSVPLDPILKISHFAFHQTEDWHLESLDLHPQYVAAFATCQVVEKTHISLFSSPLSKQA